MIPSAKKWIQRILTCLKHEKRRCTYGAVAGIIIIANQGVGRYLGVKSPKTSWVVLKATGQPSGDWAPNQLAKGLCNKPDLISCPNELKKLVCQYEERPTQ